MSKLDFNKINIRNKKSLTDALEKFGFVPFFTNSIEGFSIEEHVCVLRTQAMLNYSERQTR